MRRRSPLPPFPDGWYALARSADLAPGGVLPLRYFDRELVLYRTQDGAPCVLDAICPHLGAHLGRSGTVAGDRIACPFHGWQFDPGGQCVHIPYATKIPPRARVASLPVHERNGVILAYHGDGAPPFEIPVLAPFDDPDTWSPPRVVRWRIRTHNQEIMENVIDAQHFRCVHGMAQAPSLAKIEMEGSRLSVNFRHGSSTDIDVTMFGLGVQVVEDHTGFGSGFEFVHATYITPIEGEHVDMLQLLSVRRAPTPERTAELSDLWERMVVENLKRDIEVWEHKAYLERPLLCDGDGPIAEFRRWAQQFYR